MKYKSFLNILLAISAMMTFILSVIPCSTVQAFEDSEPIILGTYYDVLRDSSNSLTIEDILSNEYDEAFVPSEEEYLFFSHTDDTIWLRLDMDDLIKDGQDTYWLEATDKLNVMEVYLVKEDGTYDIQKGGISHIKEQEIQYRSNVFPITDPSVKDIYIRLAGDGLPLNLISFFYTAHDFIDKVISYKFLTGIFYGFMSSLLIYNLFLFFSLKEKSYLYYVLYMLCFIVYHAAMNSLDLELMGQHLSEWLLSRDIALSGNLLLIFMILFAKEFLELKRHLPKANITVLILLWVAILSFVMAYLHPNAALTDSVSSILAIIITLILWISGLIVLLKGHKMARFYMIGWTILLGAVLVQALGFLGIIPFHPRIYEDIPAIGAAFEAVFLSLALGDKINIMKKEHEELQQTLNVNLEHLVVERTQQLEKVNKELEYLANTDQLTQVPNRLQLDRVLHAEFERALNRETPLSIILIDIDYFKEINDEFGHQAGDVVLSEVANILNHHIGHHHTIGRWGGEEFLVICPMTPIEEAVVLAEHLRKQVEHHVFSICEYRTCSFGVATYMKGDTLHSLLARCDKQLYHAKHKGRNRVEYELTPRVSAEG